MQLELHPPLETIGDARWVEISGGLSRSYCQETNDSYKTGKLSRSHKFHLQAPVIADPSTIESPASMIVPLPLVELLVI
jgi:hypothetical protein